MESGRYARENLRATAKSPDDDSCEAAWDNLLDSEQKGLLYGTWMHACVDAPLESGLGRRGSAMR
ncbi:hypothetical protein ACWDA7_37595 [Streptomyces sp. NPDC001156]